mgnify:CR=1 FL=1
MVSSDELHPAFAAMNSEAGLPAACEQSSARRVQVESWPQAKQQRAPTAGADLDRRGIIQFMQQPLAVDFLACGANAEVRVPLEGRPLRVVRRNLFT